MSLDSQRIREADDPTQLCKPDQVPSIAEAGYRRAVRPNSGAAGSGSLVTVAIENLLATDVPPPSFAISPLIPMGVVTLLSGHGGTGKSMLGLIFAAHYACGVTWAGLSMKEGPACFVSLEDGADVLNFRLKHIVAAYGLDMDLVRRNLLVLDGTGGETVLAQAGRHRDEGVKDTALLRELEEKITTGALVVIDNASDAFDGDENCRRDVRGFIRLLTRIAARQDAAILLLAHLDKVTAKSGAHGNTYSGSTAWHNSARSRLVLADDKGQLRLTQEKLNAGKKHWPIGLEFSKDGVLVPSATAPAAGDASVTEDAERDRRNEERVLSAIQAAIAAGQDVGTGRAGVGNTFACLKNYSQLNDLFQVRGGKRRFWSALDRLEKVGKIRQESYTNSNRKLKQRWIISGIDAIDSVQGAPIAPVASIRESGPESAQLERCANPARQSQGGMGGVEQSEQLAQKSSTSPAGQGANR